MKLVSAFVLAMMGLGANSFAQSLEEWTTYQGNANHDGFAEVQVDPSSIELRWNVELGTLPLNPITAAGDKVFFSESGRFTNTRVGALDAFNGEVVWTVTIDSANSTNPPAYADGKVYIQTGNHSSDTYLRCYDAETGDVVFISPHQAQWEGYYAPTPYLGTIYINGGYYGGMYAFDGTTGAELWFAGLPQYDQWTPAVDAKYAYAYVGENSPGLYILDRFTGDQVDMIPDADFDWDGWSMNLAPVLGPQDDCLAIHDGRLISFDLRQRKVRYQVSSNFTGQVAVRDGAVYAIDAGILTVRDEATGDFLWSWEPPSGALSGTIALTHGHVIVHHATKTFLIDLQSHLEVWKTDDVGHLAVSRSALYISKSDGSLVSFGFKRLPTPLSVVPDRMRYTDAPISVEVKGTAFIENGEALKVRFGELEATNVQVLDEETITCTVPSGAPGLVDVEVENVVGTGRLDAAFNYFPSLDMTDDLHIGDTVEAVFECGVGDALVVLVGLPPEVSLDVPPFAGTLCILPFRVLFVQPGWPFEEFLLRADIPDDPALSGSEFLLQALIGPELSGSERSGAFTNCIHRLIE